MLRLNELSHKNLVSPESFLKDLSNETKPVFVAQFIKAQHEIESTWLGTINTIQMLLQFELKY